MMVEQRVWTVLLDDPYHEDQSLALLVPGRDWDTAVYRACEFMRGEWPDGAPEAVVLDDASEEGATLHADEYDYVLTNHNWEAEPDQVEVVLSIDLDGNPHVEVFVGGLSRTADVALVEIDPGRSGPHSTVKWRRMMVRDVAGLSPAAAEYTRGVYEGFVDTRWVDDDVDDDGEDMW